jgi:hypothetical protein
MFTHQEIADIALHFAQKFPIARPHAAPDCITYVIDGHEFRIEKHEGGACAMHQDGDDFEDGMFAPSVSDLLESLTEIDSEY